MPPVLPIDLTAVIAVIMVFSIVLIPVAGLTLRFAIKPAVEALARAFEHHGLEDNVGILERRLGLMESRMESMEHTVDRLVEAVEFQNELQAGRLDEGALPPASSSVPVAREREPGATDRGA